MQRYDTDGLDRETLDREMMTRCIAVAVRSGAEGEYPYGVVICRAGNVVAESTNRVAHEHDVTRHAEVVAISQAQKTLGTVSLDDCTIYVSAEPCVYCSYAIRGEPHGPAGLRATLAAYGRRLEMGRPDRRGPFRHDAGG